MLVGLFGLLGWVLDLPVLNSIIPGYKPIAPSAAILFVILGLVQILSVRGPRSRVAGFILLGVSLLVTLFGSLEIFYLLTGVDVSIEDLVLRQYPSVLANPNANISPVAGILVFLIGLAQSFSLWQPGGGKPARLAGHLAGLLGGIVVLVSAVFFLSYGYGVPLLYSTLFLPIAWTATIAALLLGIGLVAGAGTQAYPLAWFTGPSMRARLLRTFLPLTALAVFVLNVVQYALMEFTHLNPALSTAVLVILFEVVIGVVVWYVARMTGGLIDKAEEERDKAEAELRESERDLKNAQAVARIGSWRLDVRSNALLWSDETYRMFGIPRGTPLTYEMFLAAVHPEDREKVDRCWQAALHGEPYDIEHRIAWGDEVRWVHESAVLEFDPEGGLCGGFGTVQDITERRQAREELRLLNESLEERVHDRTAALEAANREMEAFCYSVSHDLRAPLRSINGFSKILLETYLDRLDETGQDYLGRVCNAAVRMGGLIDDMLNLSRIGRTEMGHEGVDLSALAGSVMEELRQRDPERKVEVDLTPGLRVTGDGALLRIVVVNLLENAWKFTGKRRPGRIEVGLTSIDQEQVYFVRDNGAGFSMAYVDKLFKPFQRLHSEDEYAGAGIGLAIVQRIISRHGGRIWAEGLEDRGATFYFSLGGRGYND